jgi:ATP-dependent DNA ligase
MGIMLRMRTLPAGVIAPCLSTKITQLPSGSQWLHEVKHNGLRIIAMLRLSAAMLVWNR